MARRTTSPIKHPGNGAHRARRPDLVDQHSDPLCGTGPSMGAPMGPDGIREGAVGEDEPGPVCYRNRVTAETQDLGHDLR